MNKLILILLVFTVTGSFAQTPETLFADNNPKITDAEAAWLNANFPETGFDFSNKNIGFIHLEPGAYYGIGKYAFPMNKMDLSNIHPSWYNYQVYTLNAAEKAQTRGYDAILVIVNKKNKGKLKRLGREKVVSQSLNRYPQIPADAGSDANALLNNSNAIFFNELYRSQLYPDTNIDFTGKRVAIFDFDHPTYNAVRKSIPEYVKLIRDQLDANAFATRDFTYQLTEAEKQETHGYDIIIVYKDKKARPLSYYIEKLK